MRPNDATPSKKPPELPVRRGTSDDPDGPREIENPGDPGPTTLEPGPTGDPRRDPRIPAPKKDPAPGI